jgi:Fe-S cluster biogenesis protein NfuA
MESVVANQELYDRIEKALDSIRPYLEADGGDVRIIDITSDMIVKLELLGACGYCPMSTMTLKAGVEESIKRAAPEIKEVQAINITKLDDPHAKLPDALS